VFAFFQIQLLNIGTFFSKQSKINIIKLQKENAKNLNAPSLTPSQPRKLNRRKKPPHRFAKFSTTGAYNIC
jgi:hypothetical protein